MYHLQKLNYYPLAIILSSICRYLKLLAINIWIIEWQQEPCFSGTPRFLVFSQPSQHVISLTDCDYHCFRDVRVSVTVDVPVTSLHAHTKVLGNFQETIENRVRVSIHQINDFVSGTQIMHQNIDHGYRKIPFLVKADWQTAVIAKIVYHMSVLGRHQHAHLVIWRATLFDRYSQNLPKHRNPVVTRVKDS